MPAPSAAPAKPAEPTPEPTTNAPAEPVLHPAVKAAHDTPEADRTSAEKQIVRAHALEGERSALQEKVAKNREYLRLMEANDELTADQIAWRKLFYPDKEKGERRSKEDIEATRQARKAARK